MELPVERHPTILNLSRRGSAGETPLLPPGLAWQETYAAALGQEAHVLGLSLALPHPDLLAVDQRGGPSSPPSKGSRFPGRR